MNYAVETKNLTKHFGKGNTAKTAVDRLNLSIREGELFSLLGVNGAGKTTTIRMLSCLSEPSEGDALLLGSSIVTQSGTVKSNLNVSPQETAIAKKLSVRENLLLIAQLYGCDKTEAAARADEMLTSLDLTEVQHSRAATLSGGMQRRLSIAMALITRPRILFLDEPTLGLDVLARRELWALIESLKGKITILLTTHYMEEAEALSDRIGIMAKGRLKAVGTVSELLSLTDTTSVEDAFVALACDAACDAPQAETAVSDSRPHTPCEKTGKPSLGRTLAFAGRCLKEMLRDPLSLIFGVGLPLVLLFLMSAIRRGTGVDIFRIEDFAPATAIFAQTFLAMFTGLLIAQDRGSAYLTRLCASPLTASNFISGYSLPILPLALVQGVLCLGASVPLGLALNLNWFLSLLCLLPSAVLFIALGLLLGCLLKETQVGGIGSALVQVVAFTSGMWFDAEMVGGVFLALSRALPFMYAVDLVRDTVAGNFASLPLNLLVVCAWAAAFFILAAFVFRRKMKSDAR